MFGTLEIVKGLRFIWVLWDQSCIFVNGLIWDFEKEKDSLIILWGVNSKYIVMVLFVKGVRFMLRLLD